MVQTKLIIICGPTCVGKTRVGIWLAEKFNGEIISADSQQVYKELNVGTAKPTAEERRAVPHHLIDVAEPGEQFDAARYVELADRAIAGIVKRGRVPFVVGGTGLYIRALCLGLMKAPGRDEGYRAELKAMEERGRKQEAGSRNNPPSPLPLPQGERVKGEGGFSLYQLLCEKDPATATRLKPNDKSRIIRALEVLHLTGRSITDLQKGHGFGEKRYETLKIGLNVERETLYARIDARVNKMIQDGLTDEVVRLVKKYGPDSPALKAVGYKEIVRWCDGAMVRWPEKGELSNHRTIEPSNEIKLNTRRYAKRQLTWFRADKEIRWFSPDDLSIITEAVARFLSLRSPL